MVYFDSRTAAEADIKRRKAEFAEHGRQSVTAQERSMILLARQVLGDLDMMPQVLEHWRKTGAGSVSPTTVEEAVERFKKWRLPKLKSARTQSDVRWRLDAFSKAFSGRMLHQLHAGELETWIHDHKADWSVRSFYKRLRPLFDHALRHRWIAENPMLLLKAPEVPRESKAVYTGNEFLKLLAFAQDGTIGAPPYILPFIALAGHAWMRTAEMVRLYAHEDVLTWEDIDWKRKRIHVRESVGKATRRRSGNERFPPMTEYLQAWLRPCRGRSGMVVPVLQGEFAKAMRDYHAQVHIPQIHNGLRRSALSHYLAAHPETGIGQLAIWAGTSEATIKRHYRESITPEAGVEWFTTLH
jgi:integrase